MSQLRLSLGSHHRDIPRDLSISENHARQALLCHLLSGSCVQTCDLSGVLSDKHECRCRHSCEQFSTPQAMSFASFDGPPKRHRFFCDNATPKSGSGFQVDRPAARSQQPTRRGISSSGPRPQIHTHRGTTSTVGGGSGTKTREVPPSNVITF
ncbi:hypothetical protein FB451DRAFT_658155 [Mycena latifolia]|nr:hypothetical protein FB451DRAFT_658155 [Mycena latifolia]